MTVSAQHVAADHDLSADGGPNEAFAFASSLGEPAAANVYGLNEAPSPGAIPLAQSALDALYRRQAG